MTRLLTLKHIIFLFSYMIFISSCTEEIKQPNILFIMADDHTSQAWGSMDPYWMK
ncbi:MAG: hypothetical protein ACFHWX_12560 [Bacteroidota bacterium]